MAAKKLPQQFPAIVIRPFQTFEGAFKKLTDLTRAIESLKRQLIEIINNHATLIDANQPITADTTVNRPSLAASDAGFSMFDTTLGQPIWWDGTGWVDATGASV